MMIISFLPSDFNAFLSSLSMLDFRGFVDFKIPFISARELSASVWLLYSTILEFISAL